MGAQLEVLSYEDNYLDLDPNVVDPLGRRVIRITNDYHDNERRLSDYVQKKMVEWLKAAGAAEVWTAPPGARSLSTHAYGGTRMGDDPNINVVNRWGMSHEVPESRHPWRLHVPQLGRPKPHADDPGYRLAYGRPRGQDL